MAQSSATNFQNGHDSSTPGDGGFTTTYNLQIYNSTIGKINYGNQIKNCYESSGPHKDSKNKNENGMKDEKFDKMISILKSSIKNKWSELARKLGLTKDEIDNIREDYCGGSVDDAMKKMAEEVLKKWTVDYKKNASCENLISALRLVNGADEIIDELE